MKHGVDPQEDALRAGQRPPAEGWGADPLDGELTLTGSDGAPHFRAVPTLAGNYVDYYAAVRDAILGKGPNPVPPEQAVALMALLDIGRQSAAEGRAIRIERP
ncbi:putative oxidoreductase YdgJ [compost metagenome]